MLLTIFQIKITEHDFDILKFNQCEQYAEFLVFDS